MTLYKENHKIKMLSTIEKIEFHLNELKIELNNDMDNNIDHDTLSPCRMSLSSSYSSNDSYISLDNEYDDMSSLNESDYDSDESEDSLIVYEKRKDIEMIDLVETSDDEDEYTELLKGRGISGYKYVLKSRDKWRILGKNNKTIKKIEGGGCFNTPKEAAIAYKKYCNINNIEYN